MDMIETKDLMIQRYVRANWPAIQGQAPFIVTGPNFRRWSGHSLERYGEHRLGPELESLFVPFDGIARDVARTAIAEFLLREGLCKALWAVNVRTLVAESLRWELSVAELAKQIPDASPVSGWTMELLSGMTDEGYYRNYVAESGVILESLSPPAEV